MLLGNLVIAGSECPCNETEGGTWKAVRIAEVSSFSFVLDSTIISDIVLL